MRLQSRDHIARPWLNSIQLNWLSSFVVPNISGWVVSSCSSYHSFRPDSTQIVQTTSNLQPWSSFYRASYASTVLAVIVCLSVCPSVCQSVCLLSATSRSCTKRAMPRITLTTPCDSPGTPVFRCKNVHEIPTTSPPNEGAKSRWRRFESAFSNNISLYLRNGAG